MNSPVAAECAESDRPDSKLTILVIDDERNDLLYASRILSANYRVLTAKSGKDAVRIFTAQHPDLLLIDIVMPDEDGFDICRKLREQNLSWQVPVIFLTAHDNAAAEKKSFAIGAFDYVRKPVEPEVINARIVRALHNRSRNASVGSANSDPLTSVASRNFFVDRLDLEWRRAGQYAQKISLLLFDTLHFSAFNSAYGFAQGDVLLVAIAEVMTKNTRRAGDLAARFEEDTFAVLLPDTDADTAMTIANTISEQVGSIMRFSIVPKLIGVVATCDEVKDDVSAKIFLQAAEVGMTRAKMRISGTPENKNFPLVF